MCFHCRELNPCAACDESQSTIPFQWNTDSTDNKDRTELFSATSREPLRPIKLTTEYDGLAVLKHEGHKEPRRSHEESQFEPDVSYPRRTTRPAMSQSSLCGFFVVLGALCVSNSSVDTEGEKGDEDQQLGTPSVILLWATKKWAPLVGPFEGGDSWFRRGIQYRLLSQARP